MRRSSATALAMEHPTDAYPRPGDLLPHADPWILLSDVLDHGSHHTTCLVRVRDNGLFRPRDGRVPAWIGLEYMAQCIAVHGGLSGRVDGEPPKIGLLLGSRRLEMHIAGFLPDQVLEVTARHVWGDRGLFVFACSLHDRHSRALLMRGNLSVFRSPHPGSDPLPPGAFPETG